jgi:ABC-type cobalamin/Fe3+-siderophores transport system ATPase subunit
MLWITGCRSRNRVLTMPNSSATHVPLTARTAKAGSASNVLQPNGCGKTSSMTA